MITDEEWKYILTVPPFHVQAMCVFLMLHFSGPELRTFVAHSQHSIDWLRLNYEKFVPGPNWDPWIQHMGRLTK